MKSQPSFDRYMIAIFIGAVSGACLTGLFVSGVGIATQDITSIIDAAISWAFVSFVSFFVWFIGIIIVGGLPGLFIIKMKYRHWGFFVGIGALFSALPLFLGNAPPSPTFHMIFASIGGFVGWVIWRILYVRDV